jgi:NAD+--dinitrogen-reductase ADP-D-ribosyltransferase
MPGREHVAVWRGIDAAAARGFRAGSLRERQARVPMNSVVSFSLSRQHAEMFGDWILETTVPLPKLLFFPGLLGRSLLAGEGEVIALGGDYEVRLAYW